MGYFEPDPGELILQQDSTVTYKGKHAVAVPLGYTPEKDTTDPLYPLARVIAGRPIAYYGVDQHAQDSQSIYPCDFRYSFSLSFCYFVSCKYILKKNSSGYLELKRRLP